MSRTGLLRVGLTGNIGAGKSTVGRMLEQAGCLVIDLDAIGHQILDEPGTPIVGAIVARFGDAVRLPSGSIDRRALAKIVFANTRERQALEAILHPEIRARERARIDAWTAGRGIAVTEAALLVETGAAARYDRLVVVTADAATRLQRIVARGLDREAAERRMAAQMDPSEKAAAADYLIDNNGELTATRTQVRRLLLEFREDLDRAARGLSQIDRRGSR